MKNTKNMNNTLNDTSLFMLYSISNYRPCIENSISEILEKLVEVIINYMRIISEKITTKNKTYYRFIFERGLEALIHVFLTIFYYTKNLDLTFYHSEKSYYFYIEFIEQISDDNVVFLQLTSRDALLFVYKKTIFDINNEYKKNIQEPNEEDKNILEIVNSCSYIYKNMALFIVNHLDFKFQNKKEHINKFANYIEGIGEILNKNKNKIKIAHVNCIYVFIILLIDKKIELLDFFKLLENFNKKIISKKKIDEQKIKNKIYDPIINNFINENELNKIVDWIFSDLHP